MPLFTGQAALIGIRLMVNYKCCFLLHNTLFRVTPLLNDVKEILMEVVQAIVPIVIVISLIQFFVIRTPIELFWQFMAGALMVTAGLFLFLVGVRVSLLPIGELIGSEVTPRFGTCTPGCCLCFRLYYHRGRTRCQGAGSPG